MSVGSGRAFCVPPSRLILGSLLGGFCGPISSGSLAPTGRLEKPFAVTRSDLIRWRWQRRRRGMAGQGGFFDAEERLRCLSASGNLGSNSRAAIWSPWRAALGAAPAIPPGREAGDAVFSAARANNRERALRSVAQVVASTRLTGPVMVLCRSFSGKHVIKGAAKNRDRSKSRTVSSDCPDRGAVPACLNVAPLQTSRFIFGLRKWHVYS